MHQRNLSTMAAMFVAAFGALGTLSPAAAHAMGQARHSSSAAAGVHRATATHNLELAAQRLREAIQTMAQQPDGQSRDQAMSSAQRALFDVNQAMFRLPARYRIAASADTYAPLAAPRPMVGPDRMSMQQLRAASDRLYTAVHAMAQERQGTRLNGAIREVNDALVETHGAMAWAFDQRLASSSAGTDRSAASTRMPQGNATSHAGGAGYGSGPAAHMGVDAVAGGVGVNARARLSDEAADDHNVKMVFALDSGNYVADVDVNVRDKAGRAVVGGVARGPWLYAKLPPGSYTATATYRGQSVSENFTVGSTGQRTAIFRWPAALEEASAVGTMPILGTGPQGR